MTLARREDVYLAGVAAVVFAAGIVPWMRAPLAEALGRLAYAVSRGKRRRSERAVRAALGRLDPATERRIVRGSFIAFWLEALGWRPRRADVAVEGLEHLRRAHAEGRGAVLWVSRGLGPRIAAGEILAERGFPIHLVQGPEHVGGFAPREGAVPSWLLRRVVNPFFDRRELRWAAGIEHLPADDSLAFTRALAARLAENRILRVTADGRMGRHHVEVPFLGTRERFATGIASLARASGACLLPLFSYRDESGAYRVEVGAPIEVAEGGRESRERAVRRFAALLEDLIRRRPEQYWAWHVLTEAPADDAADRP